MSGQWDSALLLTVDCLRTDHVGCYGYERDTTPNIDAFVEDGGTAVRKAYANAPGTRWAFQVIHAGLWPGDIAGFGMPAGYSRTLPETFSRAGFATAGFTKNGLLSSDFDYDRGFDVFYDVHRLAGQEHVLRRLGRRIDARLESAYVRRRILTPIKESLEAFRYRLAEGYTPDIPDEVITDLALKWIRERESNGEDYFGWLHFMNSHTPYGRWPEHLEALNATGSKHTVNPGHEGHVVVGERPPQFVIDAYDASIRSVDEQIGRLLETVSDETLVIITADHGESFGEHTPFHEPSLYSEFVDVPLVTNLPAASPFSSSGVAQHVDLLPTLADAVGAPAAGEWVGTPLQEKEPADDEPVYFQLDDMRGLTENGWRYIDSGGRRSLHRLDDDGREREVVSETQPDRLDAMRRRTEAYFSDRDTPQYTARTRDIAGHEVSEAVRDNLEELGYL